MKQIVLLLAFLTVLPLVCPQEARTAPKAGEVMEIKLPCNVALDLCYCPAGELVASQSILEKLTDSLKFAAWKRKNL